MTTHAIILTDSVSLLQKVKSGIESADWNVSMVDIHLRKLLCVYCPGHAGVKENDRADTLVGTREGRRQNIGTVSKATLGKLLRDVVERIWAFPSSYIPSLTELTYIPPLKIYICIY